MLPECREMTNLLACRMITTNLFSNPSGDVAMSKLDQMETSQLKPGITDTPHPSREYTTITLGVNRSLVLQLKHSMVARAQQQHAMAKLLFQI